VKSTCGLSRRRGERLSCLLCVAYWPRFMRLCVRIAQLCQARIAREPWVSI
jgi:hypothetical protein